MSANTSLPLPFISRVAALEMKRRELKDLRGYGEGN